MSALAKRQAAALRQSAARRERHEQTLRATLAGQQGEWDALRVQEQASVAQIAELRARGAGYRARVEQMLSGREPFSIESFDMCRRYLDLLDEQIAAAQTVLDGQREAVARMAGQIAESRARIARNRVRIDTCGSRITAIVARLQQAADDAEDEEAEEAAIGRRHAR